MGMTGEEESAGDSSRAEELFVRWVSRIEAGEDADFEAFCREHAAEADELESLHRGWSNLAGVLTRMGLSGQRRPATEPSYGVRTDGADSTSAMLEKLSQRDGSKRYEVKDEIARGGMGAILRVWDADLRRNLAMKVVLGKGSGSGDTKTVDPLSMGRFLEEAQITGQLDHPGIPPVHELGIDGQGRVYFTMRLVRGTDLREIFFKVARGEDGWNQTRALGVVLKVCEAMAFCHGKKVIHRDLKPANVMVGRYGEVYVMDWGLARVLGNEDTKDLRLRGDPLASATLVTTDRRDAATPDSPLVTMDGDIVGTPAFMPPEQARGELDRLGPPSDVYSVGAILYHLLAGRMPYMPRSGRLTPQACWRAVIEGPPEPLDKASPGHPAELVAICEKAMAREPADRYPDMRAMADDLRAFLENRVVQAHRTGALIELKKWVARNRGFAATLAVLVLVATAAGTVVASLESRRADAVQRDLDERLAAAYVQEVDELWPLHVDTMPRMEAWLSDAEALVAKEDGYRSELEELRLTSIATGQVEDAHTAEIRSRLAALQGLLEPFERAYRQAEDLLNAGTASQEESVQARRAVEILPAETSSWRQQSLRLQRELSRRQAWTFEAPKTQRRHDRLAGLVEDLTRLSDPKDGKIASVRERRKEILRARDLSLVEAGEAWAEALAEIADRNRLPQYDGLVLEPRFGLVPLRRDPWSGLWEFWHVLSGARPEESEDGDWIVNADTGIVLLLLPGGDLMVGAQAEDPFGPHHDPDAHELEGPPHSVRLAPYWLSKYEMTQGQWHRATGSNPSEHAAGFGYTHVSRISRTHPVEHVSWYEADRVLARWNLQLPTDTQWEAAARAGTSTPYWTGEGFDDVRPYLNMADPAAAHIGVHTGLHERDDTWAAHAPVGSLPPNPFGFHDILGNAWEWTRDWHWNANREYEIIEGSGEHLPQFRLFKTLRGGGFKNDRASFRVTHRVQRKPDGRDDDTGIRPCLELD